LASPDETTIGAIGYAKLKPCKCNAGGGWLFVCTVVERQHVEIGMSLYNYGGDERAMVMSAMQGNATVWLMCA